MVSDELLAMSADVGPSPAVVAEFRRDGHALVRGLWSPSELDRFRSAIVEAAARRTGEPPLEPRDTHGKAFLQSINLWRLDDTVHA